jgi:hypothetical protein
MHHGSRDAESSVCSSPTFSHTWNISLTYVFNITCWSGLLSETCLFLHTVGCLEMLHPSQSTFKRRRCSMHSSEFPLHSGNRFSFCYPPPHTHTKPSVDPMEFPKHLPSRIQMSLKLTHMHTHAQSCALHRTSFIHKALTVLLSCGENHTFLALFIFSIKKFKLCVLILWHPILLLHCLSIPRCDVQCIVPVMWSASGVVRSIRYWASNNTPALTTSPLQHIVHHGKGWRDNKAVI